MTLEEIRPILEEYGFKYTIEGTQGVLKKQIQHNGIKTLKIIDGYYLGGQPILYRFKLYDDNGFYDSYTGQIKSKKFLIDLLDNLNALDIL